MDDKIAKEIVKELRLIRIELQKVNAPPQPIEQEMTPKEKKEDELKNELKSIWGITKAKAGERVTF